MNRISFLITIVIFSFFSVQCQKEKPSIVLENVTDCKVAIYPSDLAKTLLVEYPDTSLNTNNVFVISKFRDITPYQSIVFDRGPEDVYSQYGVDTLSFYIMEIPNQKIIQRYDMSLANMELLKDENNCYKLRFPPNKIMKTVKMWPPYGTYDATGHRVDTTSTK